MYKTSCKTGSFQITDDGYIQIVPMFSKNPLWREPVSAVRAISVQSGMVMCAIVIHASHDRYVETLSKQNVAQIRSVLPMIQFNDVKELPSQAPVQSAPGQPVFVQSIETTVKTYKDAKHYQRDLKAMQRQGWTPQNTTDHHRDRSMAYKMFVPFGFLSGGTGQIVVTYQRPKR